MGNDGGTGHTGPKMNRVPRAGVPVPRYLAVTSPLNSSLKVPCGWARCVTCGP